MPFFSWAPCTPSYGHYLHHIPFQTPHLPKASHLRAHVAFPHSLLTQVSPILHLPGQRQALYPLSFSHCSKEEGGGCIRISPLQHHFTEGDQLMVAQKNKKKIKETHSLTRRYPCPLLQKLIRKVVTQSHPSARKINSSMNYRFSKNEKLMREKQSEKKAITRSEFKFCTFSCCALHYLQRCTGNSVQINSMKQQEFCT